MKGCRRCPYNFLRRVATAKDLFTLFSTKVDIRSVMCGAILLRSCLLFHNATYDIGLIKGLGKSF